MHSVLNKLSEHIHFYISKNQSLQCILKNTNFVVKIKKLSNGAMKYVIFIYIYINEIY